MAATKSKAVSKVETVKEKGKNFIVMKAENTVLYRIGYEGGGEVPAILSGLYTKPEIAERAIQAYQEGK